MYLFSSSFLAFTIPCGEESHGDDILIPNDEKFCARDLLLLAGRLLD